MITLEFWKASRQEERVKVMKRVGDLTGLEDVERLIDRFKLSIEIYVDLDDRGNGETGEQGQNNGGAPISSMYVGS